jgi:hypothetical protein
MTPTSYHSHAEIQESKQLSSFIEVIQKLYISIHLLDAIQVPTYAKYLRDILNKKRPLPTIEVSKLTEECNVIILNISPTKKKDLECPTIDCSIGDQHFNNALCNLGASVSVMPKVVTPDFKELNQVSHVCAQEVHTYIRIKKYQKQCYLLHVHIAIITLTSEYHGMVAKLLLGLHSSQGWLTGGSVCQALLKDF